MDSLDRDLRRSALSRLAKLAAASPAPPVPDYSNNISIPSSPTRRNQQPPPPPPPATDFEKLEEEIQGGTRFTNGGGGGAAFMNGGPRSSFIKSSPQTLNARDIEIILALCGSVEFVNSTEAASKLARLLSPYLIDSSILQVEQSPQLRHFNPSPWESLTTSITDSLALVGTLFPSQRDSIVSTLNSYLRRIKSQAGGTPDFSDDRAAIPVATLVVSLLGFFNSAAKRMDLWNQEERVELIKTVREILSPNFLLSAETAFSTIRNSHGKELKLWKRYTRQYAASGRPLGAMLLQQGFTCLLAASTSLLVVDPKLLRDRDVLDVLLARTNKTKETIITPGSASPSTRKARLNRLSSHSDALTNGHDQNDLVSSLVDMITEILALVEDGADYLQVGSAWQQRLAFSVKAYAFVSFCNCVEYRRRHPTLNHLEDVESRDEHADLLIGLLEASLEDPIQMVDQDLARTVLKIMAIVGKNDPSFAVAVIRLFPRYIVRSGAEKETIRVAGKCLARVLQTLSQDAMITTLYTLGNVLSSGNPERALTANTREKIHPELLDVNALGSSISLSLNSEEEKFLVYERVIEAIVGVACEMKDEKMVELAASILGQKVGKINGAVDAKIIVELAVLALAGGPLELKTVLKLLDRLGTNAVGIRDVNIAGAVLEARIYMSTNLKPDHPLYDTYLTGLLECIINKGDIHEQDTRKQADPDSRTSPVEPPKLRFLAGSQLFLHLDIVQLAAREISQFLQPLAILLNATTPETTEMPPYSIHSNKDIQQLFRNAWFNCVVHGFLRQSELVQTHESFLRIIARHTPPLVAETRINHMESDMDLNTILRRGMNTQNIAEQKRKLSSAIPTHDSEIRGLSYPKVIFLQAALLLESLRALEGDCSKILTYFVDPSFKHGDEATCMSSIAAEVISIYLKNVQQGNLEAFRAPYVSKQLVEFFTGCCHRVEKVQFVAAICANNIITAVPSALCQKSSMFALLELLTLLWNSCLEAETDEYGWHSVYRSTVANIQIELSDSFPLRKKTLKTYHERAKGWLLRVLDIAPLDVKGLLQKYLAKFNDENVFGHVALGRSLAYDIGAAVPKSDPRLSTLADINLASDFMAQYTIRQAYRYDDNMPEHAPDWIHDSDRPDHTAEIYGKHGDAHAFLTHLETRAVNGKFVAISEVRDILRRTAGLLCQSHNEESILIQHFVGIPFAIFTKQSIKLGISLWMGVLNENKNIAPRILCEIARNWELTVRKKQGLFNPSFDAPDAFNTKMEYVPSDKGLLTKHQTAAINMLSPHLTLLKFLSSHFHASRHGDPNVIRMFLRLIRISLVGLKNASPHPLAREARFQFILFSLQVLKYTPGIMPAVMQWKLKEEIFSAALNWFTYQPRWSYGGNKMQLRAEGLVMKEVALAIQGLSAVGNATVKSLELKQELLLLLLENEQARVSTWITPLDAPRKQAPVPGIVPRQVSDVTLVTLLQTAWNENPALAIQMIGRFPSKRYEAEVRKMMLAFPEKVVKIPEALYYIFGDKLPLDVNFQLRYLLYWAPLNPISAATYLLPSYANNPFLLQYAVRALENHSIDVTFFYVPQFVQTLRYDALGYVERWILETGKFSQLFAHQIIWNMKANAYKDEDSEIPDPIKPTLDKVMDHLISSFSPADRSFYEREFSFFGEVTAISGKLRPFIGQPKEEKKQKIEEELRKIKVDVGVYLPSNPDGIVIGIDRKSGKPLQSHAKAPYMATFRVRKKANASVAGDDVGSPRAESRVSGGLIGEEKWQACIFKVGDDCRQDMLALQLISAFRSIFNSVGLDVFVFPYRVVATAPGCGVIEVLPDSISRDMLGREAVNGLYDYFTTKHGGEDSIKFQEARSNFVQSMAAYSVISYLLQFKDRHNGNIMIDGSGHIIHIDFGFCFDIAPGGITFERAPFKLTAEMVAVMGGNLESQSYRWFEELCVKSFLACRPYCEQLAHLVVLMLDSGLPCFKPETIQNFKARFVMERSEREAADYMRGLVKRAYGSYSTRGYDQFQLLTNGIPY
ncbi:phosphatidylinositol-4- kinase [Orbilia oligospora]|uniref:1-phosphatidylinositol 4-kinase n=1 Tax=Orbilia oligospora TaxID=2813651 RepID=A0A7C8UBP3_ORBOL|nr:phosphatidylinositol-4- kinase [Orbilia oligospora]